MPADATADAAAGLRDVALFGSLPDAELAGIAARSRQRGYRRGQVVFQAGDPGDSLVVILSGRVKVTVRSADGGELILTVLGRGGSLGELSIADGGDRSADAETVEDSSLLLVPREVVLDVAGRHPQVVDGLLQSVAASLRRLTDVTSDLVFLDLPRRVAKTLLEFPSDPGGVIRAAVTQEQLAHQVAGTRQSVNAALRGFQRRAWVELRDRTIVVTDRAALERFARS